MLLPVGFIRLAERVLQTEMPAIWRAPYLAADYRCFYDASVSLSQGVSPYAVPQYVAPPTAALLNLPLTALAFPEAAVSVVVLTMLSLVVAYGSVCLDLIEPQQEPGRGVYWGGLFLMLFSTPVLFLIDRGNTDGFVLVLVCLGLLQLPRREVLGGVCLAVAAGIKVYPLLLALPLALFGKRKALIGLGAGLLVQMLVMPNLWLEFLTQRMPDRMGVFGVGENASLTNLLVGLSWLLQPAGKENPPHLETLAQAAWAVFAMLLASKAYGDWRARSSLDERGQLSRLVLYFPFLIAVPRLSYHYGLVLLLPLIPLLARLHQPGQANQAVRLTAVGLGLSQFPAASFEILVKSRMTHAIPALGLFVVMVGSVLLGWRKVR